MPRLERGERRDLRGRECARGPEGHSARHLRVNPAGYGDGDGGYGRQRRPAAATSSQSPTFERATDVYRVSVKRCRKGSATVAIGPGAGFHLSKNFI